jgi:hypothetical protein
MAYQQNSKLPTKKVFLSTIAGAVSAIVVWVLNAFGLLPGKTQIPAEVASALTTLISFVIGYIVPPSAQDDISSKS